MNTPCLVHAFLQNSPQFIVFLIVKEFASLFNVVWYVGFAVLARYPCSLRTISVLLQDIDIVCHMWISMPITRFRQVLCATLFLRHVLQFMKTLWTKFFRYSVYITLRGAASGLGDMEKMYDVLSCLEGTEGNYGRSFLTFRSLGSFMWGMIGLCQSAAVTFCDQASWQSRIAAKPSDGVMGFLVATVIWFAIPSALGTTTGMAYLVMSQQNGTHFLSEDEIDIGIITPLVYEKLYGKTGAVLILIMYSMAYMSTGSGEVMSIASIIVYDIYEIHVNPLG